MGDCIFCKIAAKEIPSTKIYEDESIYAFNDLNPKAPVHVLIIPKIHVENIAQLAHVDPAITAHIIRVSQDIANKKANGDYRLIFNTGSDAGQTVFHAHAHVLAGEKLPE